MRHANTRSVSVFLAACLAAAAGCSINGRTPVTAWGKSGVSMFEYRTDSGQCAIVAVTYEAGGNSSNSAGGVSGQNSSAPAERPTGTTVAAGTVPGAGGTIASSTAITGGSAYSHGVSPDAVNRAASQQSMQEMEAQRARNEALKSCLAGRGYTEFTLTPAQRAELAKLPQGSDQRREYLYKLGTDTEVLSKQAVRGQPAAQPAPVAGS